MLRAVVGIIALSMASCANPLSASHLRPLNRPRNPTAQLFAMILLSEDAEPPALQL